MADDLERRAGKGPEDEHPVGEETERDPDPSDYADPRVTQPGGDPAGERAMSPPDEPPAD